jgi:hypothetical protein
MPARRLILRVRLVVAEVIPVVVVRDRRQPEAIRLTPGPAFAAPPAWVARPRIAAGITRTRIAVAGLTGIRVVAGIRIARIRVARSGVPETGTPRAGVAGM